MRDHLKALQVLVYLGLIGAALATAAGIADLVTGSPIYADVFAGDAGQLAGIELPPGIAADHVSGVQVEISSPSTRQRVLHALTQAPTTILLLAVLAQLAILLHRARRTVPFTTQTVRTLRWIGVTLTAGVVAAGGEGFAQFMLSETITPHRIGAVMEVPFIWVLGGFICFAIAEMVKRASVMHDDLATVI